MRRVTPLTRLLSRRAAPLGVGKLPLITSCNRWLSTDVADKPRLPYEGVRIIEKASLLSGRLAGLMFADQGAEVLVIDPKEDADVDSYLNRSKIAISASDVSASSADIIIVDGDDDSLPRLPHQIMMRTVTALPGDTRFGDLPHDIDEDYLSALTGFFTDMDMMGWLDRPVTYTPLKLCSIYAGVIGANACAAALVDRLRCGQGREIRASRLAGGLSAIGALCLKQEGLPPHLNPVPAIYKHSDDILAKRKGIEAAELAAYKKAAIEDPAKQAWLFQRLYPFMAPYKCRDGEYILPMATFNRRLATGYCNYLGFMSEVTAFGIVDKDPYDPASAPFDDRNLALPIGFNFPSSSKVAELFEAKFLEKTALEWEAELEAAGLPCAVIQTWTDWMKDKDARASRVVAEVGGEFQLGRSAWVQSAGEYPPLQLLTQGAAVTAEKATPFPAVTGAPKPRPLEGYVICDFANVIAGPACGRMFAELGATVYKLGPGIPQHGPMVMMVWQAELHQGKESIILDAKKPAARAVIRRAVEAADVVLLNKMDNQLVGLGLNRETLDVVNRKAVLLQLKSHQGEKYTQKSNWNGYDPALQGKTGLMTRFGPHDPATVAAKGAGAGVPNFHGVASCVDYLTGYMAMWGGLAALYSRDARQATHGDWAVTSLASCASLTQLTLQKGEPPASAVGCYATGMNAHDRVYKVAGGKYIYGQAPPSADIDALITKLSGMEVDGAVAYFKSEFDALAVPVNTVKEIAAICSDGKSTSARFTKKQSPSGWTTETWEPTWFCLDGKPLSCARPPAFSGSDAPAILAALGYSQGEILGLKQSRAVVPTNWHKWADEEAAPVPVYSPDDLLKEGLE
jgi:crotonobetainyl-CoA:carnitine CoA-transferase CaiB-like acyl-CoA transferase